MAQAKEGAQAFMATSNDTFGANGGSPFKPSSRRDSDIAVLSPPSGYQGSDGLTSPTDMFQLPSRQQVTSASSMPASEPAPASDQTFWNNQYRRVLAVHETERALWNEERQFLERQISSLKEELNQKRNDSGVSYFGGKENDKVFADPDVVRQSQEKLRQLSNASPRGEQISPASGAPGDDIGRRQASSSTNFPPTSSVGNRLSSITEDDATVQGPRRVSINGIGTTIEELSVHVSSYAEDPPSPPTSAQIPTPPNAKTHAGRTPPIPRVGGDSIAKESRSLSAMRVAESGYDGFDDDRELNSPKMLPSAPRDGPVPELDDLNRKLENVASDPEANLPEAVRSRSASPLLPPSNGAGHDGEVGGVKLKTKRSMNFGAPLGNLRLG